MYLFIFVLVKVTSYMFIFQEVVEDALLNGCVPVAQAFLWKHHGSELASRSYITSVGLNLVTMYLQQEDLGKACRVLANLVGFL